MRTVMHLSAMSPQANRMRYRPRTGGSFAGITRFRCATANILGRSGSGVIVIDSATVSRHHGKLTVEGPRLFCEDLGSKNGTWVRSQRAAERLEVFDGDEIRLGSVIVIARLEPERRSTETAEHPAAMRQAHPLSDALDEEER